MKFEFLIRASINNLESRLQPDQAFLAVCRCQDRHLIG